MEGQKFFELAAAAVFGGIITYALEFFSPKAKLVIWSPHTFYHINTKHNITILMQNYSIQNIGHKTAEKIDIVFSDKPDSLKLFPSLPYVESYTPAGQYRVCIDFLAPREYFTMEALGYASLPSVDYVRCNEGVAEEITFSMRRELAKWKVVIIKMVFTCGLLALGYLVWKGYFALYALIA